MSAGTRASQQTYLDIVAIQHTTNESDRALQDLVRYIAEDGEQWRAYSQIEPHIF